MSGQNETSVVDLARASAADLNEVVDLLRESDLPTEDVSGIIADFWVARTGGDLVGTVALERYGEIGLLRSLAVTPTHRGCGLAARLCDHLMEWARKDGISDLYLLTTDADAYFERNGFVAIERNETPVEIRSTTQFTELCPDSAIVMHRKTAG
jgi:amino-acid N-acetyltransferase